MIPLNPTPCGCCDKPLTPKPYTPPPGKSNHYRCSNCGSSPKP